MTLTYPHNVVRLFADDMEANTGPIQGRIYVFILMISWQGLGFPVVDVDVGVEEVKGSEDSRGEVVESSVENKEEAVESIVVGLADCVVPISGGKPEGMELKILYKTKRHVHQATCTSNTDIYLEIYVHVDGSVGRTSFSKIWEP